MHEWNQNSFTRACSFWNKWFVLLVWYKIVIQVLYGISTVNNCTMWWVKLKWFDRVDLQVSLSRSRVSWTVLQVPLCWTGQRASTSPKWLARTSCRNSTKQSNWEVNKLQLCFTICSITLSASLESFRFLKVNLYSRRFMKWNANIVVAFQSGRSDHERSTFCLMSKGFEVSSFHFLSFICPKKLWLFSALCDFFWKLSFHKRRPFGSLMFSLFKPFSYRSALIFWEKFFKIGFASPKQLIWSILILEKPRFMLFSACWKFK